MDPNLFELLMLVKEIAIEVYWMPHYVEQIVQN